MGGTPSNLEYLTQIAPALAYRAIAAIRMQADDLEGMSVCTIHVHTIHARCISSRLRNDKFMAKFLPVFYFDFQPAFHYLPFLSGR